MSAWRIVLAALAIPPAVLVALLWWTVRDSDDEYIQ